MAYRCDNRYADHLVRNSERPILSDRRRCNASPIPRHGIVFVLQRIRVLHVALQATDRRLKAQDCPDGWQIVCCRISRCGLTARLAVDGNVTAVA